MQELWCESTEQPDHTSAATQSGSFPLPFPEREQTPQPPPGHQHGAEYVACQSQLAGQYTGFIFKNYSFPEFSLNT